MEWLEVELKIELKIARNNETHLNFLFRITDIITSKLPKTAATIIDIIIVTSKTKSVMSDHVFSGFIVVLVNDAESLAAAAAAVLFVVDNIDVVVVASGAGVVVVAMLW